jgi:two-component system alkaline phosphatase synthesis response regulator PhoP
VDDEPDIIEFVSYNLMRAGYHVITAPDGEEGYNKAVENKPDLIILDVLMPVMDGYETCVKLRGNHEFDQTKIVFLSALSELRTREFGLQLEADAFMGKPIRIDLLLKRIETWLKPSATLPA